MGPGAFRKVLANRQAVARASPRERMAAVAALRPDSAGSRGGLPVRSEALGKVRALLG